MRSGLDLASRRRRSPLDLRLALLATVAFLAGFAIMVQAGLSRGSVGPARPLARLEPATGTYFGVSLDWAHDRADQFARRMGQSAAVYVAFAHFPLQAADAADLDGYVDQVRDRGGLALLTLEPTVALTDISADMAAQLGTRLAAYNARGVPVMVRFAHEMNGSWYPWGQQPMAYVRAFRLVAAAVHQQASDSAMLWAPNYGAEYPFAGDEYVARSGSQDFLDLDTNHDGVLDTRDDMYAPYYPGDDAVDWVGMTLYHWGDAWPWGKNVVPEDGKFAAQLTGTYVGAGGDQRGLPDFYHVYADQHGKPMAIPETAAFYNTTVGGDPERAIKRAWWRQVFSTETARQFPAIKMINWFEWRKPEAEVNNAVVDWSATLDPVVRAAFVADLPSERLIFGSAPPPEATPSPVEASADAPAADVVPSAQDASSGVPDGRRSIAFAGYVWRVRATSSLEGPGPNYFSDSPEHVWVDAAGRLHLRLAPESDGRWYAAEVVLQDSLGYGRYQFVLDSRVDHLDPNVVLGLFTWSDDPSQDHRELDIEFGRFGQTAGPAGRYTRQPWTEPDNVFAFEPAAASESTHRFDWHPDRVAFASWIGAVDRAGEPPATIAQHTFAQAGPEPGDEQVHLNLWLDAGNPPTDGQPIEVVVRDFRFVPAESGS